MDAWIAPQYAPWFSLLSLTALLSLLSIFVRRGEHRGLVTVVWGAAALAGVAFLVGALAAFATGQPWWVLIALGVPGIVLTTVFGWSTLYIGKIYDASEHRRSLAKDL
jgi:fatty acid desaturase